MGRQIYEAIVDGILGGGVYALMAVGLTLIFGVLDIINIAQGILVVLGAYLSYVLSVHLHIDLFVGLLITVPAMFVIGVAIQWLFIRPLRGRERTSMSLLACYAVALIIEGVLYRIFGPELRDAERLVRHLERARRSGSTCRTSTCTASRSPWPAWRRCTCSCTGPGSAAACAPPCRTRSRPG